MVFKLLQASDEQYKNRIEEPEVPFKILVEHDFERKFLNST
jgi:hypothetical protein